MAAAQSGAPGTIITHTLRMTNTGPASAGFTPTISGQAWPTALVTGPGRVVSPNTLIRLQLNPGEGRTSAGCVTSPITSPGGAQAVKLFRARSPSEPAVTATLTTTARYPVYLPVVLQDSSGILPLL